MLRLHYYKEGKALQDCKDIDRISDLISEPSTVVWLDAQNPTEEEISLLAEEFGFHQLAIDNFRAPHNRPEVDEYPGYLFIVAMYPYYSHETERTEPLELDFFVGKNYVVTLHQRHSHVLDAVKKAWEDNSNMLNDGAGMLLYDLMDGLVDAYFPVLDNVEDRLDEIEDQVFADGGKGSAEEIFKLKRELLIIRRMSTPLRDALNTLTRRDHPMFSEQTLTYLRDTYDHVLRIVDSIDTYRDILSSALDAYLTVISNQLNGVMKTLTIVTTILISSQIISGIYGMNFKYMPELGWRYGYPVTIGLMLVIASALLYYFKKIKWI